jgi:hypothetical protein
MQRNQVLAFQRSVAHHLQREENPEIRNQARLVGDFIAANKRDVMFVIIHGTTLYEIKYKMPVPDEIENLFAEQSLASVGPSFYERDVAVADAPALAVASATRFGYQRWTSEVQRLETKLAGLPNTHENRKMRRTIQNILEYWRGMRSMLLDALDNVDVVVPGSGSNSSSSSSGSSGPKSVGRSSSRRHSSRRRYSSAKSHRTSTRRSSPRTSDPKPKGNSDPRRRKP